MARKESERRLVLSEKTFKTVKTVLVVLICICVITAALLWVFDDAVAPINNKGDAVTFFDVGQGDCALIQSGNKAALIDTGTAVNGMKIVKKLRQLGVSKLDVMLLSHPHDDHIGSAEFLITEIPIDYLILPDVLPADDENALCYKEIKELADYKGIESHYATEGMIINIGNFECTVLLSDEKAEEENDTSIVVMAKNQDKKFLFVGDAEKPTENKLINGNINFDCDVLKVGHHGSNTSSSKAFLNVATPKYSVISVGRNNSYSHPSVDVLKRLGEIGTTVLRTDINGDIRFTIENGELVLQDLQ